MEIINIILPIVYIIVGVALVWFVIELAVTIRKARSTVEDVNKTINDVTEQLAPTLDHVEKITAQIEPVAQKVDPLVDRVSLTIDAANLEIMRVDEILEDVTQITNSVTKTMDTVDNVASAPLDLVNSVTDKMRARFKTRGASEESVRLGSKAQDSKPQPVRDFVDATADAASAAVKEQRERYAARKVRNAEHAAADQARTSDINQGVASVANASVNFADADTSAKAHETSSSEDNLQA